MAKRLYMFGFALAVFLSFSLIPTGFPSALAANPEVQQRQAPQQPQQQQMQQTEQMEQLGQQQPQSQSKTQFLLTGKITMQRGHYFFHDNSSNTTLRVSNPSKVRKYKGDRVEVRGTIDRAAQTIHISRIRHLTS